MALRRLACSAAASILALGATLAQAAEITSSSCTTGAEMQDLLLALAPTAFDVVRDKCGAALPASSPLRQPANAMMARYDAAAKAAWPGAKAAMVKLMPHQTDEQMKVVNDILTPQMVGVFLAPEIAKILTPATCPDVDRIITLLAPLPPENLSELFVRVARYGMRGRPPGKSASSFQLCPE